MPDILGASEQKQRIIQEFVPGKQVTLAPMYCSCSTPPRGVFAAVSAGKNGRIRKKDASVLSFFRRGRAVTGARRGPAWAGPGSE